MNQPNGNIKSIAFGDDQIVYIKGKYPNVIKRELESVVNKINILYITWKLNFQIHITNPISGDKVAIPHKDQVKYLGAHLDNLFRLQSHLKIQLNKANSAYHKNARIFHSKWISKKAKIVCYMLLIRPVLTYAAPIWFNINAANMDILRRFEKECYEIVYLKIGSPTQTTYTTLVILKYTKKAKCQE